MQEITRLFPGQEVFSRKLLSFDPFEDEKNLERCEKYPKKKEGNIRPVDDMCFTCTAIHAGEREVCGYGLMDATGDSAHDAYVYGAKRMLPAGVVPITVESPFQNGCKTGLS